MNKRIVREQLLYAQGQKCIYCRCPLTPANATLDHLTPKASGGKDAVRNLAVACADCNGLKGGLPRKLFLRILKGNIDPSPEQVQGMWRKDPLDLLAGRIRRRIFVRADNACERIRRAVG